jgi:23S rRNA (uracil1939-C5)-methyltransferase
MYEQQLIYKRQHVLESLEHIGLIKDVTVHPTVPSEVIFGYRNKMEFSCADRRWLLPEELDRDDIDRDFALGLHVPGTFHKVIDTNQCLLQPDLGNQLLGEVRAYMRSSELPVYGLRSHDGFWRFLVLRHSVAYDQWMVNVVTAAEDLQAVQPLAERLVDDYPQVVSVINNVTSRKAGVAVGEFERVLAGTEVIADRIGGFEFEISANSFFQTNSRGAACLYDTVKEYAGLTGDETVLDLYSGTGTIPILMSAYCRKVLGIEASVSRKSRAARMC